MTSDNTYQRNRLSAEYLASFGIDPKRMPENGWDEDGYTIFGGEGEFGDSSMPVLEQWPSGFDVNELRRRLAFDSGLKIPDRDRAALWDLVYAALDDEIDYLRDDGSDMEHAVANSLSRIRDALAGGGS